MSGSKARFEAPLQGLLFDLDGTLIDSEPMYYEIWKALVSGYGHYFSERHFRELLVGKPGAVAAQLLVTTFRLPLSADALLEARSQELRSRLQRSAPPLMPQARALLLHNRELGLKQALVTASGRQAALTILRAHQLCDCFDVITTGDDVQRGKPHPDCYRYALARLNLPTERCVALEDSGTGLQAARAAGIYSLGIRNGANCADDVQHADLIVEGLAGAGHWIEARADTTAASPLAELN